MLFSAGCASHEPCPTVNRTYAYKQSEYLHLVSVRDSYTIDESCYDENRAKLRERQCGGGCEYYCETSGPSQMLYEHELELLYTCGAATEKQYHH